MRKKRVAIRRQELAEIGQSIRWCDAEGGFEGTVEYYIDLLCFYANSGRAKRDDIDELVGTGPWTRDDKEAEVQPGAE